MALKMMLRTRYRPTLAASVDERRDEINDVNVDVDFCAASLRRPPIYKIVKLVWDKK